MREPSYRVYRSNLNLPRMPNGSEHLIDDTDGRWADYIAAGWITPVGPPADYQAPKGDYEAPERVWTATDDPLTAMAWDSGRSEDSRENDVLTEVDD